MTINREKCLEIAYKIRRSNDYTMNVPATFNDYVEAICKAAYQEGVKDTERQMRGAMDNGDIDWRGCNEI